MEGNGRAGGMMPGMLGLEMPLHQPHHHHHHHHQQTPPPPPLQQQQQHHLLLFATQPPQNQQANHNDAEHNAGVTSKLVYPFGGGAKVKPAPSSEDEPSAFGADECGTGGGGAIDLGVKQQLQQQQRGVAVSSSVSPTTSPWQRMKWTDTMVRLLIMVVYCVGDDNCPDGGAAHQSNKSAKKGGSAAVAAGAAPCAGLLQQQQQQQKKGKWKSVSRAMMEKGHYVSPQQCEDKFNDLNKRYKRVNDILGKGTACRVVENQALLDTMDHLSLKAKEEVRKLLNSKHLFFREMCAYHRSCATTAAANSAGGAGGEAAPLQMQAHHQACDQALAAASDPSQLQQQRCFHPSDFSSAAAFSARGEEVGTALKMMTSTVHRMGRGGGGGEGEGEEDGVVADDDDDEEDNDDDDEDDYGDDDDDVNEDEHISGRKMGVGAGGGGYHDRRHLRGDDEEEDSKELLQAAGVKRRRRATSMSLLSSSSQQQQQQQQQQLRSELAALTGTPEQQRQWLRWREVELEERRVSYGRRALELEKQRFKWLRFSGNKEREMERTKLENDRLSLENDRMLLLLRQKAMELFPQSGNVNGSGAAVEHLLHNSGTSPNALSTSAS